MVREAARSNALDKVNQFMRAAGMLDLTYDAYKVAKVEL
jgi:hypothetical protein